jgi:hypothetical protein
VSGRRLLDTVSNIVSPIYFFDYEDDDEDDKNRPEYQPRIAILKKAFKP